MSKKYERITIKPISTGFLIEKEDRNYYDGDTFAFATWDEVVEFIKNHETKFLPNDDEKPSVSVEKLVELEKAIDAA